MERPLFLLLCVFSTFYFVNSQLYPVNHEVVYNYKGMVQSGTGEPIATVSDFAINAKIHVKGIDNYTLVTIEDLTYGLYSGNNNEFSSEKMNFHDIREKSKSIYKPFIIKYNMYGKTIGILTENDDKVWSVNIKKAIASLLQLNVQQLDITTTKTRGFQSEEHTVYGICNVLYDVMLSESNKYNITKHINPSECKEYKMKTNFNIQAGHCDVEFESPISTFSYIDYKVEKTDSGFLINSVKAKNNIYLNTLNGHTDTQYVLVEQSLDFEKNIEFSDHPKLETIISSHKTKLHFLSHSTEDRLTTDITGGRPDVIDMEAAMRDALTGLNNVVDHMRQHQVDLSISFKKQGRAIHFFLFKARFLNEKYLRQIYKKLEDDTSEVGKELLNAFLSAVPVLGTYESHIFIRNLIWQGQVNENQAIEMLKELPFGIKYYNKKIWKDFSVLTYSDSNVTVPIRYTATLTVSNLISKYNHEYPDDAVVINYVENYIDLFKKADTEMERVLMLSALTNIKVKKVLKFVEEIIQSESENITPHLKTLATFGFKDELLKSKYHLNKLYWPILKNNDEDLELRSAAVIMLLSDASTETMLKLFWHMQSYASNHVELYKLYYTEMESMSKSKTVCNQQLSLRAKRIFNLLKKQTNWQLSSFRSMLYDYYDSMFGFGAEFRLSMIGNINKNNFMSFYAHIAPQLGNLNLKPNSYYIYMKPTDKLSFNKKYPQNRESSVWTNVIEFLMDVDISFITLRHGQIAYLGYENFIENILKKGTYKKESYSISQAVTGLYVMPTLMGVPVTFNLQMPTIDKSLLYIITKPNDGLVTLTYNTTTWNQQTYGIEIYNPIEDSWHGCRRFHIFESNLPFELKMELETRDVKNSVIEFSTDKNVKQFGAQTFVFSDVFLFSDNLDSEGMKSFCGDCKARYVVSQGDASKKKHVIIKSEDNSDLVYDVSYFECEQGLDITSIKKNIFQTYNKNWGTDYFMLLSMSIRHLWAYSSLLPGKGMCGFGITIKNFKRIMATIAETTITANGNEVDVSFTLEKASGKSDSCEIKIKKNDDNFDISALLPGEKNYKICMAGKEIWRQDEFDQQLSIYAGHNFEDKCDYNETFIGIVIKGMKSEEQVTNENLQNVSIEGCKSAKLYLHPVTCIVEDTNLRRFEYHIRYNNLPKIVQKYANNISDMLRYYFGDYFERLDETEITENLKLIIEYPFDPNYSSKMMDLYVQTKNEQYKYKNVPYELFSWMHLVTPYGRYSTHHILEFGGIMQYDTCNVESGLINNIYGEYTTVSMSSTWVNLVHEVYGNNALIETKTVNDIMMLRASVHNNTLIVSVKEDGVELSLNDKLLSNLENRYYNDEWFYYKVFKSEQKILLHIKQPDIYIEYNGKYIKMLMQIDMKTIDGKCFERLNQL